jgi:hypothetical protein
MRQRQPGDEVATDVLNSMRESVRTDDSPHETLCIRAYVRVKGSGKDAIHFPPIEQRRSRARDIVAIRHNPGKHGQLSDIVWLSYDDEQEKFTSTIFKSFKRFIEAVGQSIEFRINSHNNDKKLCYIKVGDRLMDYGSWSKPVQRKRARKVPVPSLLNFVVDGVLGITTKSASVSKTVQKLHRDVSYVIGNNKRRKLVVPESRAPESRAPESAEQALVAVSELYMAHDFVNIVQVRAADMANGDDAAAIEEIATYVKRTLDVATKMCKTNDRVMIRKASLFSPRPSPTARHCI